MEIKESKTGDFVVLEPVGRLDTKSAPELEKKLLELMGGGQRRFIVDFASVEFLSSAGLRVLLMMAKKLAGDGHLALCRLNDAVREVFDIAGFTSVFTIRASPTEAVEKAPAPTAGGAAGERAAEDAARALGISRAKMDRPAPDPEMLDVAKRAATLLGVKMGDETGSRARPAAPAKKK